MAYKKQGRKDREDEKLAMEVKGVKNKMKKMKGKAKGTVKKGGWIAHVKAYAKKHGIKYGEALKKASASYKKK